MEFNATFLAVIVSFILFVFLMNRVLYAPILGIMEDRKNFIDGNYKSADENDNRSEELTNQKNEKLAGAKDKAKDRYSGMVKEFKSQRLETVQNAQNSAKETIERERAELENLSNEVKTSLKDRMNDLADDIAEKILGYRSTGKGFDNETVDRILWSKNN